MPAPQNQSETVLNRLGLNTPKQRAFTLVELLVVIGIILVMAAMLVPAFTGMRGASDLTKAAYDIAGTLEQARAYAMGNNTFVWVGLAEVDAAQGASANFQAGTGVLAIAVVASKDGTRGYYFSSSNLPSPAWANYSNGANLVAINKLQRFESIHLAPLFSSLPKTGSLGARPTVSSGSYQLGNTTFSANPSTCVTPFDWPLGKAIDSGQYSFKRVINFDPQGVARIQYASKTDDIVDYMEIGLQPTHGTVVMSGTNTNAAAVQLDCMTGTTRIYRP